MEEVVLVDAYDNSIGSMEKQQAHVVGALHRAVSVFIFNSKNELLLQQRAAGKYHSALQWANTCCGHPRPGESAEAAAGRRLQEEMGIVCPLEKLYSFVYRVTLENGLTEHEYDHVFTGIYDGTPEPDENEVAAWKFISAAELEQSMEKDPWIYTPWFIMCIDSKKHELFKMKI